MTTLPATLHDVPQALSARSPQQSANPQQRFALIDAVRGIAAIGIASFHIHRYGPLPQAADSVIPSILQYILNNAWVGVQVFFVIAGFVLAYRLRAVHLSTVLCGKFVLRRILRLGLPYWATVVFVALLNVYAIKCLADESLAGQVGWTHLISQFVFCQDILGYGNLSAGMWFVAIDLQFGLLFVVLVGLSQWLSGGGSTGSGRARLAILIAIICPALLAMSFFNLDDDYDEWIQYFFHMPVLGAVAWWTLEGRLPRIAFWAYLGAMLLGLAICWRAELVIAAIAGVALYGAGRMQILDFPVSLAFQQLGKLSYSLFLIHYPISWIVMMVGYRLTGTQPTWAAFWLVASLAASLLAAQLLHVFVESPANRLARLVKTD